MKDSRIRAFLKEKLGADISRELEEYLGSPFEDRWLSADRKTLERLRDELMPLCRQLGGRADGRIETAVIDVGEMSLIAALERKKREC